MKTYKLFALLSLMLVVPSFVSSAVCPVAQSVVPAVSGLVAGAGAMYLASEYDLVRKEKQSAPISTLKQVEQASRSVGNIAWSVALPVVFSLWVYAMYTDIQLKKEEARNKEKEKQAESVA